MRTVDVDLGKLPVPDWGLECPACGYPLKGLPRHRCPECGTDFNVPSLVRPWTRLREPRYAGHELPMPDYGLACTACGAELAGATSFACPKCAAPVDLDDLRPKGRWFVLDAALARELPVAGLQAILADENVPHFGLTEKTVGEIYGGQSMMVNRLRVPTEFYFEVLWLIRRTRREMDDVRSQNLPPWNCSACGEENPAHFEVCWNCGDPREGRRPSER